MTTDVPTCLRSAELIATETAEAIYQRHRVPGTQDLFRHDVRVHRLTYATRDVDGTEVTASGAILVPAVDGPAPVMCYHRGTIIPVHWERRAPSCYDLENNQSIYENYEMSFLAAGFAAAGYVTVAPDLIGYGASRGREHPYMHAPSLAWVSRDMLWAAREFAAGEGIPLGGLFITRDGRKAAWPAWRCMSCWSASTPTSSLSAAAPCSPGATPCRRGWNGSALSKSRTRSRRSTTGCCAA
jgi:hypothetical protein